MGRCYVELEHDRDNEYRILSESYGGGVDPEELVIGIPLDDLRDRLKNKEALIETLEDAEGNAKAIAIRYWYEQQRAHERYEIEERARRETRWKEEAERLEREGHPCEVCGQKFWRLTSLKAHQRLKKDARHEEARTKEPT